MRPASTLSVIGVLGVDLSTGVVSSSEYRSLAGFDLSITRFPSVALLYELDEIWKDKAPGTCQPPKRSRRSARTWPNPQIAAMGGIGRCCGGKPDQGDLLQEAVKLVVECHVDSFLEGHFGACPNPFAVVANPDLCNFEPHATSANPWKADYPGSASPDPIRIRNIGGITKSGSKYCRPWRLR